jgi:hypothetical protein
MSVASAPIAFRTGVVPSIQRSAGMARVLFFTPSSMQVPSTVLRTITVQAEYALASKHDLASYSRCNGDGIWGLSRRGAG